MLYLVYTEYVLYSGVQIIKFLVFLYLLSVKR